jgi:hypothetical protein
MIGNFARKSSRNFVLIAGIGLLMAISGCGGDDEAPSSGTSTGTATSSPKIGTVESPTTTERETEAETETTPAETPEDQPGGAGDEEPARTLALFTAKDGRITPRVVRVPAFISIEVQLRSPDGQKYGLRFGDVTIRAGGGRGSVSTTIDGLRQGEAITGKPTGAGTRVRIEATAEPGP